jgi:hypothetical protein
MPNAATAHRSPSPLHAGWQPSAHWHQEGDQRRPEDALPAVQDPRQRLGPSPQDGAAQPAAQRPTLGAQYQQGPSGTTPGLPHAHGEWQDNGLRQQAIPGFEPGAAASGGAAQQGVAAAEEARLYEGDEEELPATPSQAVSGELAAGMGPGMIDF